MNDDDALSSGKQPYDRWVGVRVGAVAGGLIGGILTIVVSSDVAWSILVLAGLGAAVG